MEKVWAKVNGNFEFIDLGNPVEIYDFLFAAPVKQYLLAHSPFNYNGTQASIQATGVAIWNIIVSALNNGYFVGAGTNSNPLDSMIPSHSYSVLDAYVITNSSGTYNIIELRNPYGIDDGYTGKWNDLDSGSWTTQN